MSGALSGPWTLRGEAIWLAAGRRGPFPPLPDGIDAVPGPCAVAACRYTESPVGPFLALTFARPARSGARPGWCTTAMVVDQAGARAGARLNWGFPAEVGELRWMARGDQRTLVWEDRDLVIRARGRGPRLAMAVPHPDLLLRGGAHVRVPDRLWARCRAAGVRVHAQDDDDLAWLAGRHVGVHASGVERVMQQAQVPFLRSVLQHPPAPNLADVVRREPAPMPAGQGSVVR